LPRTVFAETVRFDWRAGPTRLRCSSLGQTDTGLITIGELDASRLKNRAGPDDSIGVNPEIQLGKP
jgi:hypothetical protein